MTKELFWKIVEDAKAKANGNLHEMHELLLDSLLKLDAKEIYRWGQIYGIYHMLSDTLPLYMAAYVTDNGGDDNFEYFRGWLIVQGEKFFLAALANPDSLADLPIAPGDMLSFEDMMGMGYEAYADKLNETGEIPEEAPLSNAEADELRSTITFASDKGLENEGVFFAQIPKRIPKLCKKFGYEHDEPCEYEAEQEAELRMPSREIGQSSWSITGQHAYFDPKKDKVLPLPNNAHAINAVQIHQGTELADISCLAALTGLKRISFDAYEEEFTSLKDISVLGKLPLLEELCISNIPQLTDISFIRNLPKLKWLGVSNMPELTNVSGVEQLEHLETFIIFGCPKLEAIPSLQASSGSLKTVRIVDNKLLQSIECLRGLPLIEEAWLQNNQLQDISPLEHATAIKRLDLARNKISDIEVLRMLVNIKNLDLSRNKISDISPLKNLRTTTNLFLSGNKIKDISALNQLQKVTYMLDLSKNKELVDISPLKNASIGGLDLNRTAVTDISPVEHVEYVDLRYGR